MRAATVCRYGSLFVDVVGGHESAICLVAHRTPVDIAPLTATGPRSDSSSLGSVAVARTKQQEHTLSI